MFVCTISCISLHCLMWCHQLFYRSVNLSSIILPLFLYTVNIFLSPSRSQTLWTVVLVANMLSSGCGSQFAVFSWLLVGWLTFVKSQNPEGRCQGFSQILLDLNELVAWTIDFLTFFQQLMPSLAYSFVCTHMLIGEAVAIKSSK